MRFIIQRVQHASVTVDQQKIGNIGKGYLVLIGVSGTDTKEIADKMIRKMIGLRIFDDENGKMNIRPADAGAEILIVSQFTLWADARSRRPGFTAAARPETAIPLYERVVALCRESGFRVETGEFGAEMLVESVNNGPVTILLDTREL